MKKFQITFVWPSDDWTWINVEANDFHQAMLIALDKCPTGCRVHKIEAEPEGKTFEAEPNTNPVGEIETDIGYEHVNDYLFG